MLSDSDIAKLFNRINFLMESADFDLPLASEKEPAFVARCVTPIVLQFVSALKERDLFVAGEGAGPIRPVNFLGLDFYPDVALLYRGKPVLAYEVKYLRGHQRQALVASAVGQAMVYAECGYQRAGVVFFDLDPRAHYVDVGERFRNGYVDRVSMTVRRKMGAGFLRHAKPLLLKHDGSS